jgi:hypothetical protein
MSWSHTITYTIKGQHMAWSHTITYTIKGQHMAWLHTITHTTTDYLMGFHETFHDKFKLRFYTAF